MMINILLITSIIFLIHEVKTFIWPEKYHKKVKKIKDDIRGGFLNPKDRPFITLHLFYFIWSVIGLFTNLWLIFLSFILFSISTSIINNKIKRDINLIRLRRFDSFISIIFIIILIIISYAK